MSAPEGVTVTVDEEDKSPLFSPPLWQQRRALVSQILRSHAVESVLDFGCGSGALLEILLNDTAYGRLAGVDIDPPSIESAAYNCQPADYDRRFLRECPVELDLYVGSVADADVRLCGFDAIASVEVIEHLDPPVLEAFPVITLGIYKPKVMVVSTPNADFNVNFPKLKYGTPESIMRNDDHRFEWTQNEFETWARSIAKRFNYAVEFKGVGLLAKPLYPHVGHCTQLAIFTRTEPHVPLHQDLLPSTPYQHHTTIEFPYFTETGFTNDDIIAEMRDRTKYLVYNELDHRTRMHMEDSKPADFANGNGSIWPKAGTILLDLEKYWNILRIRQLCKKKTRFIEVLRSKAAIGLFELAEEDDKIRILYEIPPETRDSHEVWDDGISLDNDAEDDGDSTALEWGVERDGATDAVDEVTTQDDWGGPPVPAGWGVPNNGEKDDTGWR